MEKRQAKFNWISRGLKPEHLEHAWEQREKSTECDWCAQEYKSSRDKCMDHCRKTDQDYEKGDYRNILCQNCNHWRNNCSNISHYLHKRSNIWYYQVQVIRDCKNRVEKPNHFQTKEAAETRLKEFKEENWWYFPFEDVWN